MNDKEKARQMYLDSACQRHIMFMDGVAEEYKKLGATPADEKTWREEYIQLWISKLSLSDLSPVTKLQVANATEALPQLIEMSDKGDSYAKLWYANAICSIAFQGLWMFDQMRTHAIKKSISLWESILETPVRLEMDWPIPAAYATKCATLEEYILTRSRQELKITYEHAGIFKFLLKR